MNARGDTIIEVLLAITVFSLVAIGAITIMNQGTNSAQRALEITLVRQQIDGQAEAIRAAQQAAAAGHTNAWRQIAAPSTTPKYTYGEGGIADKCPVDTQLQSGGFFAMDVRDATKVPTSALKGIDQSTLPYAQIDYDGGSPKVNGLWIEREYDPGSGGFPDLYTFTVNACWDAVGLDTPMKISTVVRLYDPGT